VVERFDPSLSSAAAAAKRYCIPFPATTAEVAEMKNFLNFFKQLQLVITLPVESFCAKRRST
jgi:hypothetical protein